MKLPDFSAEKALNKDSDNENTRHTMHEMSLHGLISERIGLGDVIKGITSSIGIKPCGGCEKRAETLNNWLTFVP